MANLKPFIINTDPSVDSAKIRIPVNQVQVLNQDLYLHKLIVSPTTGEVEGEFKSKAHLVEYDGIKTRYCIEDQVTSDRQVDQFLTIGINSKMLKSRYQEGITLETLPILLEEINSQGQVKVLMESLLLAQMTDIDFKSDFYASPDAMKETYDHLFKISKAHKETGRGATPFNRKNNQGIQWNTRETNSVKTAPYCKIYTKDRELNSKSREFTEAYLKEFNLEGVYRLEVTLKNKKHIDAYGIDDNTVQGILSLPPEKVRSIILHILNVNVNRMESKAKQKATSMNWKSQERLSVITAFLNLDQSIEEILHHFTKHVSDKRNRAFIRKQVEELYSYLLDEGSVQGVDAKKKEEIKARISEFNRILSDVLEL